MKHLTREMLSSFGVPVGLAALIVTLSSCKPRAGPAAHPYDVADVPGTAFTIRVSEFLEEDSWPLSGAYYRFESLPRGGKDWVLAVQVRTDDDIPLPVKNVRFVSADTAFLFMGRKYAVTTDGGKHWTVWNAETDLPGWQGGHCGFIGSVEMTNNGVGKMILRRIQGRAREVDQLSTSDFGRHWTVGR